MSARKPDGIRLRGSARFEVVIHGRIYIATVTNEAVFLREKHHRRRFWGTWEDLFYATSVITGKPLPAPAAELPAAELPAEEP